MTRETKLLHLRQPASLGDCIDGWRVFWLGGWDRGRLFFIVMVERTQAGRDRARSRPRSGATTD